MFFLFIKTRSDFIINYVEDGAEDGGEDREDGEDEEDIEDKEDDMTEKCI